MRNYKFSIYSISFRFFSFLSFSHLAQANTLIIIIRLLTSASRTVGCEAHQATRTKDKKDSFSAHYFTSRRFPLFSSFHFVSHGIWNEIKWNDKLFAVAKQAWEKMLQKGNKASHLQIVAKWEWLWAAVWALYFVTEIPALCNVSTGSHNKSEVLSKPIRIQLRLSQKSWQKKYSN